MVEYLCGRVGCGEPATCVLLMAPQDTQAWLVDTNTPFAPDGVPLCRSHADRISVPFGWSLQDDRPATKPKRKRRKKPAAAAKSDPAPAASTTGTLDSVADDKATTPSPTTPPAEPQSTGTRNPASEPPSTGAASRPSTTPNQPGAASETSPAKTAADRRDAGTAPSPGGADVVPLGVQRDPAGVASTSSGTADEQRPSAAVSAEPVGADEAAVSAEPVGADEASGPVSGDDDAAATTPLTAAGGTDTVDDPTLQLPRITRDHPSSPAEVPLNADAAAAAVDESDRRLSVVPGDDDPNKTFDFEDDGQGALWADRVEDERDPDESTPLLKRAFRVVRDD